MRLLIKAAILFLILAVLAGSFYMVYRGFYGRPGNKQPHILVVFKSVDSGMEFWRTVSAGIDTAAKEFDVNAEIKGSISESDVLGQIRIIEESIKLRPDAIVMAATDFNALAPLAEKIKEAGIKLITIDSAMNSDIPDSFIATDNVEAAKKEGEILSALVKPNAKIAVISHIKTSSTAIEREQGVKLGFAGDLSNRIDGIYYSYASEEKAYEITKDLLTRKPDIMGIAGLNEPSTVGAAKAVKDLKLKGRVKVVGFDSSVNEIKLIEEGVIQATVVQKPFNMGYLGIKTAVQALKGQRVDKRIDTGSAVITKENMYSSENQKLLFPFAGK